MSVAGPLAREREGRQESEVKGREKEEVEVGKEAEEDPLGRLTRCYRGVCRGMLCYWSVKRTLMNASPKAQLSAM